MIVSDAIKFLQNLNPDDHIAIAIITRDTLIDNLMDAEDISKEEAESIITDQVWEEVVDRSLDVPSEFYTTGVYDMFLETVQ